MKYLHLINDEKFTDFTISLFEEFNAGNNAFFVSLNNNAEPKYTKSTKNVSYYPAGSEAYYLAIRNLNFDVLVVHFLDYYKSKAVIQLKEKKIIVWLSWGADIYNTKFYTENLYQAETSRIMRSIYKPSVNNLKDYFRGLYYLLSFKIPPFYAYKKAVSKVDFCATVVPSEFNILQRWPFFKARQVSFSYACIEDDFKDINAIGISIKGKNILIGNSISPTSNHLDVFKKLDSIGVKKGKSIVVPLNYGSEIIYRDKIIEYGYDLFGSDFKPLLDFLLKDDYINILKECNVAILNHDRQQGMGNVILLLWLGCKLFLSDKSSIYTYLKNKGFFIFSFQDELDNLAINSSLKMDQVERNRYLLMQEYGRNAVSEKIKSLLNTLVVNKLTPEPTKH